MILLRYLLGGLLLVLALGALATLVISLMIEARYPPQGKFVTVGTGRLHYLEREPADARPVATVVLLHGASSNAADMMLGLGERLAASRYRVMAFDRPGHGWSDRILGSAAASPARQADLIAEALRKLGVRNAVAVGHSWSGSVVPNLALDHRDVTGAIMILSGVTHPWPGGAISWYYAPARSWLGSLFTRTITTPLGAMLLPATVQAVFTPQEPPGDYTEAARIPLVLLPSPFRANAEDVAGLYEAVAAQSPRYREIDMPATILGGSADEIVWTDLHARSFAREVRGAKLIVLPGLGHMTHHVAKDAIVDEIEALARRVAPGAEALVP